MRAISWVLLFCICAVQASAQPKPAPSKPEIVEKVGPGISRPVGLTEIINSPECDAALKSLSGPRMPISGTVELKGIIGVDGVPRNITVVKPSEFKMLDAAAITCFKARRYKPALQKGKSVQFVMPFTFKLALR